MGQLGPGTQGIKRHLRTSWDSPRMSTEDGTSQTWDAGYQASLGHLPGCQLRRGQLGPGTQGIANNTSGHLGILPGCPMRMGQLGSGTQGISNITSPRDSPRGWNNSDLGHRVSSKTLGDLMILPGCPLRIRQLGPGTHSIS